MSSPRAKDDDLRTRTLLLREVTELLMWELATISDRKWEDLPELKRKKSIMADRLREFDWTPGPEEHESLDLLMLKSQITDLEYQSKPENRRPAQDDPPAARRPAQPKAGLAQLRERLLSRPRAKW